MKLHQTIRPAPWMGGVQGQLVLRRLQGQWETRKPRMAKSYKTTLRVYTAEFHSDKQL
jgi:hypothetical protein